MVRADQLIPIARPEATALLLILAGDAAKGVRSLDLESGESILLTGVGTVGLLTLFNLHSRGHTSIDVVEPLEERRMLAVAFGAARVFSPDEMAGSAARYTSGFECSGAAEGFVTLQNRMAHGGRICVLSDARPSPLPLIPAFHSKELRVQGSSDGLNYREYSKWFFEHAPRYPFERIFDHAIQFSELPKTLTEMAQGLKRPRKVIVSYGG